MALRRTFAMARYLLGQKKGGAEGHSGYFPFERGCSTEHWSVPVGK